MKTINPLHPLEPQSDQSKEYLRKGSIYVIASAIVALWISFLPTSLGSIVNFAPTVLASRLSTIVQPHKSDKLPMVRFEDRWNALGPIKTPTNATKNTRRVPFGCESPYGFLAKVHNLSGRCIAFADKVVERTAFE